ncbi:hypothetical protein SP90_01870 [Halodesulfovibrio spirochaetisodalis]|uniref:Uncharacterized protein n=1 Tax=Halodesulfovibrio spirochaetisodalis TaxID=1560234 RepID=A0A1B7XMV0_9BACT|nr:hypothetical protein SP90_01870 [Halodesulfovibrio spirochaetisodalis]
MTCGEDFSPTYRILFRGVRCAIDTTVQRDEVGIMPCFLMHFRAEGFKQLMLLDCHLSAGE